MRRFKEFLQEGLDKVQGTQYGSNEGGLHVDSDSGKKYYIKKYKNPDQAKVESLTGKIYHHMGIKTVNPEVHDDDHIKTEWNEHLKTKPEKFYHNLNQKQSHQIGKIYHAGILTKNWDVVGLETDNIVHNEKTGDIHAIDHGGAFHFRAQGSHKDYDPGIGEKSSLRNNDNASGRVFNHVFEHHPDAEHVGLEAVKQIDDSHVHHLFKNSGLSNWKDLHHNFNERKKKLIDSYN